VHGDLWFGNAMLSTDGSAVTGLVDWTSSLPSGLPAVDMAHLMISSRAIASGRDEGMAAARLLDGRDPLTAFERELLDQHGAGLSDVIRLEDLVLLAWLQHVGHVLGGSKLRLPRLWLRRNVDPVLALV
jgi:aminoglycoside phosphotransferase (APT) family kinase protein